MLLNSTLRLMIVLRRAKEDDLAIISDLAERIWPETYSAYLSEEQLKYMLDLMYNRGELLSQLQKGHTFLMTVNAVKSAKHWCPFCAGKAPHTIEDMRKLAQIRDGKCLSSAYHGVGNKLKWQCVNGHKFMKSPNKIISHNQWCKICGYANKAELRRMASVS